MKNKTEKTRITLTNFTIAGFSYYDGALAFSELTIGTPLQLKLEPENRYDDKAVAVYLKDYKLGYIPKNKNTFIAPFLMLECNYFNPVVQRVDQTEHPEEQIQVILYLEK